MLSPSGNCSSITTVLQNSGSESDLQQHNLNLIDERKRKRKQSNRESARRSRMRKQKHLDDLTAQVAYLQKENDQIVAGISLATQHYVTLEAENSVLRAQFMELNHRLQSLNEIADFVDTYSSCCRGNGTEACLGFLDSGGVGTSAGGFTNPLSQGLFNQVPIMAATATDIFHC